MPLVEAIVADTAFLADAAVGAKVALADEKLVGLIQALPLASAAVGPGRAPRGGGQALLTLGYVPFVPPNVAGFPKGASLLGPHQLVHAFDLLSVFPRAPKVPSRDRLLDRLGLFDVSDRTRTARRGTPIPHASRRLWAHRSSPPYEHGDARLPRPRGRAARRYPSRTGS